MPQLPRKPRGRIAPTRRELTAQVKLHQEEAGRLLRLLKQAEADLVVLREQVNRLRAGLMTLREVRELHCPICPMTCPHDWTHSCTCGQHAGVS